MMLRQTRRNDERRPARTVWSLALALLLGLSSVAAKPAETSGPLSAKRAAKIERKFGVRILSLRPTAAETMLDLRYRVTDPKKARLLVDRTVDAYLVDQATGRTVAVPSTAKIGPMRQTLRYGDPPPDRVLFVLFANPGRSIGPGDQVTIEIGDFKVENLTVQ